MSESAVISAAERSGRDRLSQRETLPVTPPPAITVSLANVADASDESLSAGAVLGRFTILERLGRGGFGTVWKAHDPLLDRHVAIKVSRTSVVGEPRASALLQEARLAAQLRHPNIVRVHELGAEEDFAYIVSDLVDGVTLADWLKSYRPSPREAASLCAKIAKALHHAHEHGVIHRDLKPGNVMLGRDGEPHVVDFGLGRRATDERTNADDNQFLGTPAYMPPEQAQGAAHEADGRADVYSLGVILFEQLTGRRPFEGSMLMLLHQLLTAAPPRLRIINRAIPPDLEQICLKCLAKAPDDRYESAAELADDLDRYLTRMPVRARRIGLLSRSWRLVRRHPAISGTSAAMIVAISLAAFSVMRGGETNAELILSRARSESLQDQFRVTRMTSLAGSPQYLLGIAEAEKLRTGKRLAPSRYYDLACVYSLAGASVMRDARIAEERREALTNEYRSTALDLLDQALDFGYFDSPDCRKHLRNDPQLSFLHGETRFNRLVQSFKEDWK